MSHLIAKLHDRPSQDNYSDVTFKLPDGSSLSGHRLILAIASPFFEAQFYGLMATDIGEVVPIKDVDSNAFRRLMDFIYNSGALNWTMDSIEYWNLLAAAHMYLVPGLIEHCNEKLSDFMATLSDNDELIAHVNRASQLYIYEDISKAGVLAIKERLREIIQTEAWLTLQESVVLELVSDINLKVTECELFHGMVRWCRSNSSSEEEAVSKFQEKFASKIIVKNISQDSFLHDIGPSNFLDPVLFKNWTFQVMTSKVQEASRFALNPYKIQQTSIEKKDFLEPRNLPGNGNAVPNGQGNDFDLWTTNDEFADVDIDIKIYQKISEGVHVPRGKFGILLETIHMTKNGGDRSCITERVSVKMVAKKSDGTVVKKLFKPIEDSCRESPDSRTNIFVLSKNKEERMTWNLMEIVVIIDRRPKCHIKGISGEDFAEAVCTAPTMAYLERAHSFSYDVGFTIKAAVADIADKLKVRERNVTTLSQWLYIFTKGYVSNLRSRRALPNDYWTAETVEDYMRCKVINYPIGVHNEGMRRDAFRTWIISRKLADEKEKDKKNLFVCNYNPTTQVVKYVKNICLSVETKVETLGLLEHINLGTIKVTEEFFHNVTFSTAVTPGSRIFVRRIFPIQNETDEKLIKVLVTEAKKGEYLTHIDDCHVLVIQEGGHTKGIDFDEFIISRIREIAVRFEPQSVGDSSLQTVDIRLDPKLNVSEVLKRLSEVTGIEEDDLDLYKCYSNSKSDLTERSIRPSQFPMEASSYRKESLASLIERCNEIKKTVFYGRKSSLNVRNIGASMSHLEEQLTEQLEEHVVHVSQPCSPIPSSSSHGMSHVSPAPSISPSTSDSPSVEEDIMDIA